MTNYLSEPLVEGRVCSGSQVEGHHSGAGVTADPVTVTGRKDGRGWWGSACLLFLIQSRTPDCGMVLLTDRVYLLNVLNLETPSQIYLESVA